MVQKLSATVRNFSTRARDGKTLPASVSMVMPRYFRSLRGHKIQLLLVYHNPEGVTKREERLDGLLGFPL